MPVELDGRPTARRLAALQQAWCFSQPFHNLDLLAGARHRAPPLDRPAALERCAMRLGGPCHVQSWGFLSQLQERGFDAQLCGATIHQPNDHLLVRVVLDGRTFLCDVGNGQPYLEPFPLDRLHFQAHLGWETRSVPDGDGLTVERRSPDQPTWRRVYAARAETRRWDDFAGAIAAHHLEPGFGPFLSGLRVVRIGATSMITVRDDQVTTYHDGIFTRRTLTDAELVSFIREVLGLGALPVDDAVAAWRAAVEHRA